MSYDPRYDSKRQQNTFLRDAATGLVYGSLLGAATGDWARGAAIGTGAGALLGPTLGRGLGLPGFGGGARRRHRRHSRSRRSRHSRVRGGVITLEAPVDPLTAGRHKSRHKSRKSRSRKSRSRKSRSRRIRGGQRCRGYGGAYMYGGDADMKGGAQDVLIVPVQELANEIQAEAGKIEGGRSRRRSRSRRSRSRRSRQVRGGDANPKNLEGAGTRRRRRHKRRA